MNMGAIWRTSIKRFEPEAGISLAHLNFPNESFYNEKERLPLRYVLHGKVKARLSDELYFQPLVLFMNHKGANETVFGTEIGLNIFKKHSNVKGINAGIFFRDGVSRNPDAIAITGGATIGRIDVNLGYDINVSDLKVVSNSQGAFEISVIYRSISTVLNSYSIPCERY